ncbi:MAG TPA: HEAT repeat domain-containing protein [Terriglobales bacterium]
MTSEEHLEQTESEQNAARRAELERKSTEELFTVSTEREYDDDTAWEAVKVLQLRGTPDVFEAAKRCCRSENPIARARGLSVLAQLGAGRPDVDRPFIGESVSIAIDHLRDSDAETVRCAAWALSHLGTDEAVSALIALRSHSDPDVRHAVASCIELRKHPEATRILLALMEDSNEVVRDWATFALGSGDLDESGGWRYTDSPEIRAAFHKRLKDTYEEAQREAIWGLAKRKDRLGIKLLLNHLESEEWWSGDEDAAEEVLNVKQGSSIEDLCNGLRRMLA